MLVGTFAFASPAAADPLFSVSTPPQFADFHPGDMQTISFTVTDNGEAQSSPPMMTAGITMTPADDFTLAVSGCTGPPNSCTFNFAQSNAVTIKFTVQENSNVTDVPMGTSLKFNMSVVISDTVNKSTSASTGNIFGMPKPVVVSGAVYDSSTGKVVSGALVKMLDDANHIYTLTTKTDGKFTFTSTATSPIVGSVSLGASKKTFNTVTLTVPATATMTGLHLYLEEIAPSASPPAVVPTATAPTAAATPTATGLGATDATDTAATAPSGGGGFTKLVLIVGLILVIGGGAVIAFMMLRRKKDDPTPPAAPVIKTVSPATTFPRRIAA